MTATSASWKHLEPPAERENLGFEDVFSDSDAERMMRGVVPEKMEDKWFIFFADGWLRFHRSWTGTFIYALRLDGCPVGVRVVESWVNRNPQQYSSTDTSYDRKLVRFLIDALLLQKLGAEFPKPPNSATSPSSVTQHSVIGRGYPESNSE